MRALRSISENLTNFEKSILIFLAISLVLGLSLKLAHVKHQEPVKKNVKVNINEAGIDELLEIPGVGPRTAKNIVEYRKEHGKFRSIEEIRHVKGIGKSKFKRIKDYIKVQ